MQLNKIQLTLTLMTLTCPLISLASYFCPNNFNQINIGDSITQVQQVCGNPTQQSTTQQENQNVPQQWTYFVQQNIGNLTGATTNQGAIKTEINFDQTGKVVNITVNGNSAASINLCGSAVVQIGSMMNAVKTACGTPSYVNKQTPFVAPGASAPPATQTVTTFTYNSTPPFTLTFTDGKLTSVQQQQ